MMSGELFVICGELVRPAKNGASRGVCTRPKGHTGIHGNETCTHCGVQLTPENSPPISRKVGEARRRRTTCTKCDTANQRRLYKRKEFKPQIPGEFWTFPCGCSGILPEIGKSNLFAHGHNVYKRKETHRDFNYTCRVSQVVAGGNCEARSKGYKPIDPETPHHIIRAMMDEPLCWRCKRPLDWTNFGKGKTPHLHHNHDTGEIYGFTHPHCNPLALEQEIDELKARIHELESQLNLIAAVAA